MSLSFLSIEGLRSKAWKMLKVDNSVRQNVFQYMNDSTSGNLLKEVLYILNSFEEDALF